MKICPADKIFSQYIRLRDGKCCRCGSMVELNDEGLPVSHQNSHYFGRSKEGTRFDPLNCDTLCWGCHKIWGSDDKEGYRSFKINQIGEQEFKLLQFRAFSYHKKDRKMSKIIAKVLLDGEINK